MSKSFLFVISMWIVFCGFIIYMTELSRKEEVFKFNCANLIGGWHPDVPKKFSEMCLAAKQERSDR
jgi:hypothetical protein